MEYRYRVLYIFFLVFISCTGNSGKPSKGPATGVVDENSDLNIGEVLEIMMQNGGRFADSQQLFNPAIISQFYAGHGKTEVWSRKSVFTPLADSLHRFITGCMSYGLFPGDYHLKTLQDIRRKTSDSASEKVNKSALLTKADLLYTDAFFRLAEHLKKGRLSKDSITLTADTALAEKFYISNLNKALEQKNIQQVLQALEPRSKGYLALKQALPRFIDSMDTRHYTYVVFPSKDSMQSIRSVIRRLHEGGIISTAPARPDSAFFAAAISKYQKAKGIKPTGKMTADLARDMNTSDWYRFKRVAVTMDRYKAMPEKMPDTYIWVNLPGYYARIIENDTVVMQTRVIVGRPANRTPVLNSEISNIVLYPTWSVPASIAVKEMLPIARRNPGYFARRGFKVFDSKGRVVDPYSVNWSKYSGRGLPFRFRQNEGGGNALGVIKFNFENPYAVYLHDTNQRYLFERSSRALSHGCVRVQLWDSMARFIINRTKPYIPVYQTFTRDSITGNGDTVQLTRTVVKDSTFLVADSLKGLMAKKRNMPVILPKRIPIYIRYFGCEGNGGKLQFYDDIYLEDKTMIDKFFARK